MGSRFAGGLSDLANRRMTPCLSQRGLRRCGHRRLGGGGLRRRRGHLLRRNDAEGREAKNHQSCDYADGEAHIVLLPSVRESTHSSHVLVS